MLGGSTRTMNKTFALHAEREALSRAYVSAWSTFALAAEREAFRRAS